MYSKELQREFERHLPKPVYLIWSEENYFLEDVLAKAVYAVIASHLKDFNYNVFYPPVNPYEILDTAMTLPLMAQRRFVVLKDFHLFPASSIKAIISYFEKPCESTCMLLLSRREPRKVWGDAQRWLDAIPIFSLKIKESDIPTWVKQKGHEKGINITQDAVDYLIESVGPDIGLLMAEIEKIVLSGLKSIKREDLISSTGIVRGYTPFDLVDAIIADKKAKAFRILNALIESKSSETVSILGALNWHYRQFYTLWKGKGKRPLKMRENTYRALLKHLPSYTEEDFYHIFQRLHEADICMKSGTMPELTLETLLLKLLRAGN